jgi:hypothetical protein
LVPPLPVQPVLTSPADVRVLGAFVASAKQQNHLSSGDGVVDAVAWPDIDAKLPHAIPAELVVTKVAEFDPVDSAVNGYARLGVADLPAPCHEDVFLILREIVADLVHVKLELFSFIDEMKSRRNSVVFP